MDKDSCKLISNKEVKNIEPKINHLKLPKLSYYNNAIKELEKINIIGDQKLAFNNKNLYNNLGNNTINIYITKLENFKCLVPENFL